MVNKITKVWVISSGDNYGNIINICSVFDSEGLANSEADKLDKAYPGVVFYIDEYIINEGWDDE